MPTDASVRFFDDQFRRQVQQHDLRFNPFEEAALPWLRGRVLDYGCGLGNLSLAAARRGCTVLALDASETAVAHLRGVAAAEALPVEARREDLRFHRVEGEFDSIACIGLLMFFDCATAWRKLHELQEHLHPGGVLVLNVLEQGTTYLDMFDPAGHCLFAAAEVDAHLRGWEMLHRREERFPAPNGRLKAFLTLVARKPVAVTAF
jgi:tellurite methyltransferase